MFLIVWRSRYSDLDLSRHLDRRILSLLDILLQTVQSFPDLQTSIESGVQHVYLAIQAVLDVWCGLRRPLLSVRLLLWLNRRHGSNRCPSSVAEVPMLC